LKVFVVGFETHLKCVFFQVSEVSQTNLVTDFGFDVVGITYPLIGWGGAGGVT